jgi:asparagine synthase (glutamine-hydrolysing)
VLAFLAWFTERGSTYDATAEGMDARLATYLVGRVCPEWQRHTTKGDGWGVFATAADSGEWRWRQVARSESLTAISVGMPVGLAPGLLARGPVELARRSIRHAGVLSDVVPPFGFVVVDESSGSIRVCQDWLGMARLYVYRSQGVVAFSNLPTMLPYVLGDRIVPDEEGWAYFIGGDAFNGNASPVRGVTQVPAGVVVTGRQDSSGHWDLSTTQNRTVDDIVAEASAVSDRTHIDLAAEGIRRAAAGLGVLWPARIPLGLSGGKDSRLVAAALLTAGIVPRFSTRADSSAEAETAAQLVELARSSRGMHVDHTITEPFTPEIVATHALRQRARQLLSRYDFMFGSTYLLRPPVAPWRQALPPPTVGGAAGEIATSKWIPETWASDDTVTRAQLLAALRGAVASQVSSAWQTMLVRRWLDVLVHELADTAKGLGLQNVQTLHWTYLMTRMRRWSTASHNVHQVTPLLTPEFIQVAFAMTLTEKRTAAVHRQLTERLMPEWAGVPWIKNYAGVTRHQMPQVWDGDGIATLGELLDSPSDGLTGLLDKNAVSAAVGRAKAAKSAVSDGSGLRVFTLLAVASDLFREMNDDVKRVPAPQPTDSAATPHAGATVRAGVRQRITAVTPLRVRRLIRSTLTRSRVRA